MHRIKFPKIFKCINLRFDQGEEDMGKIIAVQQFSALVSVYVLVHIRLSDNLSYKSI